MYLPILLIILFSFAGPESKAIGDWGEAGTQGLQLYVNLFQDIEIMSALGNTMIIALVSSIIATLIGTTGAMGVYYFKRRKMKAVVEGVNQVPVVNAEIVTALSLTVFFVALSSLFFHADLFGFWTLLAGHLVLTVPFVYLNVKPKLMQMDPSLYEAALDLGCSSRVALWKIVIPEILPGILSGFLIAFTLSLDDFVITAFTRGPGLLNGNGNIETLSTLIQSKIKRGAVPPEMRALTGIIFATVVCVVTAISARRYIKAKRNVKKSRGVR